MKKRYYCLPMLLSLAACSPHIDPAASAPRTVLYLIPMTDDIHSAVAFVEDKPGSRQTTPGLTKLDNNHVEFFPKNAHTVTYRLNDQPVSDRETLVAYLRRNAITSIALIENARQTRRTFILRTDKP